MPPTNSPKNPKGLQDLPFTLPQATDVQKRSARSLASALKKAYPDAHCELNFSNPHELLIATILSAQATDVGVNKATPALFAAFPRPIDYAKSTPEKIQPYIKSIGLFRNKSKSIHAAMVEVVDQFQGRVPQTMTELLTLRGVARKTAGVVLSEAFDVQDAFVVDTHVSRFAVRYGLVDDGTSIPMIERTLMALFPRPKWREVCHTIIWHCRRNCPARGMSGTHPICKKFGVRCDCKNKD